MLSVVIPAYNEEQMVQKCAGVLDGLLSAEHIPYELIFVDDGSNDGTWDRICAAHVENEAVRGIHFSRNFGKEAAIFAGLSEAHGACAAGKRGTKL